MTQSKLRKPESILPVPDQDALIQSEKLIGCIKAALDAQGGAISFDEYMNLALYEPGLGYYSAGSRKFGSEGDFVTAPELSPIFSQCLAHQCKQVLNEFDTGIILELGAGTGAMAREILLELEKQNSLPNKYLILEVSADLKQRQQASLKETIPHLIERVEWLDALPEDEIVGVILANEVLDALPVKRFKKTVGGFKELKVGLGDNQFIWVESDAEGELLNSLEELENDLSTSFPENFISEINTQLGSWLSGLENVLNKGVMFFIDYGYSAAEYYHPERMDGSLLCHYRHRVHSDPFYNPGLQDITCSANFTAIAECADSIGLHVSGYTNQTYFLFGCGLEELLADMNQLDIKAQTKIAQQVRILTMPEEMGERFKVMALTKDYNSILQGFTLMDQRVRL
ncbi:MAG: SAM-dependent methyltransferase [marine bacterium B5-7]|nr:MAG: SAM-dependent methyltransferase [marine bacterium B5-7]